MQASSAAFGTIVSGNSMVVEDLVTISLPYFRTNLCTCPNFKSGSSGWSAGGTVPPNLGTTGSNAYTGNALLVTWGTGGTLPLVQKSFASVIGQLYMLSAYVYVSSSSPQVQIVAGGSFGTATTGAVGSMQRIWIAFTATATTTTVQFWPTTSPTSGNSCFISSVLFEPSATLGAYFDGDTASASWLGTAELSTSELPPYDNLTLAVQSIKIDRQSTTDMPAESRLLVGYSAASADIVLTGMVDATNESLTAAGLFNPASATSPLYRTDVLGVNVVIQEGLYNGSSNSPELITMFTGEIDGYVTDPVAGTVTITCLDYRTKLRTAPVLPSFVSGGASGFPALTSEYALDYIGRHSGSAFLTWPAQRVSVVLAASMRGSVYPETGAFNTLSLPSGWTGPPTFGPGVFGTALTSTGAGQDALLTLASPILPAQSVFMEFFCTLGASGSQAVEVMVSDVVPAGGNVAFQISVFPTSIQAYVITPSGGFLLHTWTTTVSTGVPHYVRVQFGMAATATLVGGIIELDGVIHNWSGNSTTGRSATATCVGAAVFVNQATIEGLQVTTETAGTSNNGFTPTAVMDPSLNSLVTLPDVGGKDAWGVIQAICDAEGGFAGFDELGIFRFYNRTTLRSRTSTRTITSTESLTKLQIGVQNASICNHVQVPVNALAVQPPSTIWQATSPIIIPAGSTYTTVVTTSSIVVNVATTDSGYYPDTGAVPGLTYWRANGYTAGVGPPITSGVTVTVKQLAPTSLLLTIVNNNTGPIALVSDAETPYNAGDSVLLIGGQAVTAATAGAVTGTAVVADVQYPPVSEGGAITSPRGEILLQIPANDWQQDYPTALLFAQDLLIDQYIPRPILTNVNIVADPRIQLTDRMTINDPDVSGITSDVVLFASTFTSSATAWNQDIDVRMLARPGGWILGTVGQSELGTDTYL